MSIFGMPLHSCLQSLFTSFTERDSTCERVRELERYQRLRGHSDRFGLGQCLRSRAARTTGDRTDCRARAASRNGADHCPGGCPTTYELAGAVVRSDTSFGPAGDGLLGDVSIVRVPDGNRLENEADLALGNV